MKIPYVVIPPVRGGFAFWVVTRPMAQGGPTFDEIVIHRDVPEAGALAADIALRLNRT